MLHLFSSNLLFHFLHSSSFSLSHTPYLPLCPLADPCAHFLQYKGMKNVNYYDNSRLFRVFTAKEMVDGMMEGPSMPPSLHPTAMLQHENLSLHIVFLRFCA